VRKIKRVLEKDIMRKKIIKIIIKRKKRMIINNFTFKNIIM